MTTKFIGFIVLFFFGIEFHTSAQQKDFGDVSQKMLRMEVYEKDSLANAVVVFDVAEAFIDENLEVEMKRHVRIKVLTDDGLSEGDISLGFRHDDPEQKISKLKVHSYELEESGKLKTHKLGRRDKFENKISDTWTELKFVVPNLKKGSIFEFEYTWKSESIHDLQDWYFQRSIPVMWSEYKVSVPEWFTYLIYKRSYYDFLVDEVSKYNASALFKYDVVESSSFYTRTQTTQKTETIPYVGNKYHWVMKDLPAIKNEPYMKAKSDYYAQVQFQLSLIQFPNSMPEMVLNTWQRLVDALEENDKFGKRIDGNRFLKEIAEEEVSGIDSETEKMLKLYSHIVNTVNWNKEYDLLADNKLQDVYESGNGSSTEINLLLIQLLREAGLKAYPVIISTRNNGEIIDLYPITTQFNHTLVYTEVEGVPQILDATNKDRPYNILPTSVLNDKGLLINGTQSRWLPLRNNIQNKTRQLVNVNLDGEGNVKGTFSSLLTGQYSYNDIQNLSDKETAKKTLFKSNKKVNIDSVSVVEPNDKGRASYSVDFNIPKYINTEDTVAYLSFNTLDTEFKNPFKLKDRKFPIDYEFQFSNDLTLTAILPQGWVVVDHPKSLLHRLENGNGEFKRLVQINGNIINILYSMKINKKRFMPEEYTDLKSMYELIESSFEKNLVLKKKHK